MNECVFCSSGPPGLAIDMHRYYEQIAPNLLALMAHRHAGAQEASSSARGSSDAFPCGPADLLKFCPGIHSGSLNPVPSHICAMLILSQLDRLSQQWDYTDSISECRQVRSVLLCESRLGKSHQRACYQPRLTLRTCALLFCHPLQPLVLICPLSLRVTDQVMTTLFDMAHHFLRRDSRFRQVTQAIKDDQHHQMACRLMAVLRLLKVRVRCQKKKRSCDPCLPSGQWFFGFCKYELLCLLMSDSSLSLGTRLQGCALASRLWQCFFCRLQTSSEPVGKGTCRLRCPLLSLCCVRVRAFVCVVLSFAIDSCFFSSSLHV
jgi:hypothetical protein